ncbi:MAG: Ku protein, partial [Chloroflexi bacterium]|nr:Ku protein [Chloroflexota bacterium]
MRAIWKGTISFGLVSIPISLVSAKQRNEIKFNMLDSEDSSRIRYLRVNESTGEEVPWDRIIKGYEFEDGEYVTLTDEDFEHVEAEGTRTIDI